MGLSPEMKMTLEIERSKLNRQKALILFDKAILLYFSFLFVGVIGFINGYLSVAALNVMVIMSFGVLVLGIIPYTITMHREEMKLDAMLQNSGIQGRENGKRGKKR